MITPDEIISAHERIFPYIHRTPIFTSSYLNKLFDAELFFKAENLQKTGSFKARGATNSILQLSWEESKKGVATHSSGNHGQALAWAAQQQGIPAYIVMPENSPQVKINAVREYGAEVIFCKPVLAARERVLSEVMTKYGSTFVPPYNFEYTICGQATAAREILEEIDEPDIIMAPVGGGGLISGTALSAEYFSHGTQVIGCEPAEADDARQSLKSGKLIPANNPVTIADGLRTSLGDITFEYIKKYVADIITCPEEGIMKSMRLIWERMKLVVEPSAAVPLATIFENPEMVKGKKVAIILSGGNVDLDRIRF